MADIRHDRDRHRDRMGIGTDRPHHQLQVHPYYGQKGMIGSGPSTSQVIAAVTLLPVSGTLLALAGLTLIGTLIGLAVATPVFIIFSPVIVPAAFVMGLAVMAFLTSGAFGITGLSALSYVMNSFRGGGDGSFQIQDQMDYAKRRMQDAAQYAGQKTKDVGQTIKEKAGHETGRHETGRT